MRLLLQIPLSLGILLLTPFAIPLLATPFLPTYWSSIWSAITHADIKALYVGIILPMGAFGILGLWTSVVSPAAFIWRHGTIRKVVLVTLAGGTITAVSVLVWVVPPHLAAHDYSRLLGDAWLYIGSSIVAVWNFVRFVRKPSVPSLPLPAFGARG